MTSRERKYHSIMKYKRKFDKFINEMGKKKSHFLKFNQDKLYI